MADFPKASEIVPEYRSRIPAVRWLFHKRFDIAMRLGRLNGKLKVVDLGCGEGLFLQRLRASYPDLILTGIDHNPNAAAQKILGVEIRQGDLTAKDMLAPTLFDRIFCLDVLEHIQDLSGPLGLVWNALAPRGVLVISAPAETIFHKICRFLVKGTSSEVEGPASSPHYHRAKTLRQDIIAAGFEPLDSVPLPLPRPFDLIWVFSFRKNVGEKGKD